MTYICEIILLMWSYMLIITVCILFLFLELNIIKKIVMEENKSLKLYKTQKSNLCILNLGQYNLRNYKCSTLSSSTLALHPDNHSFSSQRESSLPFTEILSLVYKSPAIFSAWFQLFGYYLAKGPGINHWSSLNFFPVYFYIGFYFK